jgi:hypothetical protein
MISPVACRAYDMAALKLKGCDRANTNFPKEAYHHEAFMLVGMSPCFEDLVLLPLVCIELLCIAMSPEEPYDWFEV